MDDLTITKLCAEAMGYKPGEHYHWRPLHDDAQAMALVKKFRLRIHWLLLSHGVVAEVATGDPEQREAIAVAQNVDLNRAICECVAKMQAAK